MPSTIASGDRRRVDDERRERAVARRRAHANCSPAIDPTDERTVVVGVGRVREPRRKTSAGAARRYTTSCAAHRGRGLAAPSARRGRGRDDGRDRLRERRDQRLRLAAVQRVDALGLAISRAVRPVRAVKTVVVVDEGAAEPGGERAPDGASCPTP